MFSDWYEYCKENYESITSVVELEAPLSWHDFIDETDDGELYDSMGKLPPYNTDIYIPFKNNLEVGNKINQKWG